ncbi:MAG TPA: nickel pincer cofactor biosynthesis protein LarC [Methanocella sp.]|nr:nickel pincer cofactor biosynthesis protein LarC [Methanocella sp.]
MRVLYVDCFSGISGDMFLGAMVDMGVGLEALSTGLDRLGIPGLKVVAMKTARGGIAGTKVDVLAPDTMQERHLSDITGIIDGSGLSSRVRKRSRAIFRRLAAAESKVHGISMEEVHFHEVGAMDTIADVIGAAICLEEAGIEEAYASPVNVGSGSVMTSHGMLPVPAPATLEILSGIPIYSTGVHAELATPTGAAILAEICKGFGPMPTILVEKTGYGAGSKELETPNLLRVITGEYTNRPASA